MIYINLLPVREIRRRNKAKNQIFALVGAFAVLLALLGIYALLQANTITARNATLQDLKKEKQRYTKIINQIKQLEKDKQVLENRIAVINKLKASSSLTVHALDEVAKITPSKRIWLTTLNQSGGTLKISGMALDNRTIAKYMDDLKTSQYIKDVRLASSSLKGYAGRNLKAFSLTCAIAVPEAEQPPKKN